MDLEKRHQIKPIISSADNIKMDPLIKTPATMERVREKPQARSRKQTVAEDVDVNSRFLIHTHRLHKALMCPLLSGF